MFFDPEHRAARRLGGGGPAAGGVNDTGRRYWPSGTGHRTTASFHYRLAMTLPSAVLVSRPCAEVAGLETVMGGDNLLIWW